MAGQFRSQWLVHVEPAASGSVHNKEVVRSLAMAVLLAAAVASAQSVVGNTGRIAGAIRRLDAQDGGPVLRCQVTPIKPGLNFGFRFQAGYIFRFPLNQFSGPRHGLAVLMRITPEGGGRQPVYLTDRLRLPPVPKTNLDGEATGVYLLGEGRYTVKWMVLDDAGRSWRKEWKIDARLGRGVRNVQVAMPPGTVDDLSLRHSPVAGRPSDDAAPLRLTVLLNAGPLAPQRTNLRAGDRFMLLGTLSTLLERVPARSVRLVVFNLDQQKILFRQDDFRGDAFDQVAQSISSLQLNLVDYHVLQNHMGHLALLADMLNRELHAEQPSDAVVFLGPQSRFEDKIAEDALEKPRGTAPRFYYLQLVPFAPFRRGPPGSPIAGPGPRLGVPGMPGPPGLDPGLAGMPDSISMAVARLKGKSIPVHTPGDFDKAIQHVERRPGAGSD